MHQLVKAAIENHERLSRACAYLAFEGTNRMHYTENELRDLFAQLLSEWTDDDIETI